MKKFFTKQTLFFIIVFAVIGFLALQVPVAQLAGSKAKFTLFDAVGPIAGAFIGSIPGLIAVFFMQLVNFLVHGASFTDAGTIIRFFPMLFAVLYFARKSKFIVMVPILAIIAWNLHPIGRSAWQYSLFWLIPIIAHFLREQSLLARALGATFTAHAVGGALWIYVFNLPKAVWLGLIPVVASERILFAIGIAAAFLLFNNVLALLQKKKIITVPLIPEEKYLLPFVKTLS